MSDLRPDGGADWPAQAADTIVRVVGQVRAKSTGPAITAARGLVYGVLAAIVGTVALVLLAVVGVRILDVYLPESATGDDNVWVAYTIVGALFILGGLVAWHYRRSPLDDADSGL